MTNPFAPNVYQVSSLSSFSAARKARKLASKRAALAALSERVGTELANVALTLALAECWEDATESAETTLTVG